MTWLHFAEKLQDNNISVTTVGNNIILEGHSFSIKDKQILDGVTISISFIKTYDHSSKN